MYQNEIESPPPLRRRRRIACFTLIALLLVCASASVVASRYLAGERQAEEKTALPETESVVVAPIPPDETAVPEEMAEPLAGRIAFINPLGQLSTVSPDGSLPHLLTSGTQLFLFPAWSPDGTSLAAIGGDRNGTGVFTFADREESEGTSLYFSEEDSPIYLYWSPDSKEVSFIAERGPELGLYLAPADGSEASELLTTGQPLYWDWLDDGERVLFHTGGSLDGARLALVDAAAAGEEPGPAAENLARPGFFQAPGIATSGRYLAYAELDQDLERWVVVEDREEGAVQRIPHSGSVALNWSPVQDQLAFISPEFRDGRPLLDFHGPLRLVDAATGQVSLLADSSVLGFFWAPDGASIAYLTLDERGSDLNASLSPNSRFRRASKGASQRHTPIRLHLWLADVNSGDSRLLATFQPTSLFLTQFLPFFDQYGLSHRLWSPDSQALVLPVVERGEDRVFVFSVHGQAPQPVAEGAIAFWSR